MESTLAIFLADKTADLYVLLDEAGWGYRKPPCQIPCPVHKGGQETRSSARLHADNSIFCFTCGRQYGPTDVYASFEQITKEEAAVRLLKRWPPDPTKLEALQNEWRAPKKKELPKAIKDTLEAQLRQYKFKVPLEKYRDWARRTDEFEERIVSSGGSEEDHRRQFKAFLQQMYSDLRSS